MDAQAQVVVKSILISFEDRQLNALVCPQAVEGRKEFVRHGFFCANVWGCVDHLRVSLRFVISTRPVERGNDIDIQYCLRPQNLYRPPAWPDGWSGRLRPDC